MLLDEKIFNKLFKLKINKIIITLYIYLHTEIITVSLFTVVFGKLSYGL